MGVRKTEFDCRRKTKEEIDNATLQAEKGRWKLRIIKTNSNIQTISPINEEMKQ